MSYKEITIPKKNRPEWKQMISGEIQIDYKNFVLQMQITQMRKSVNQKKLNYNEAIDEIYSLCDKFKLIVQSDLKQIFKTW